MEKILIVDDDKKIREIYAKLLTPEGYKVIEASSALEANKIVKREKIDLILLDIKIPEIDGSIIYEIIRSFHGNVKVIVASVYPLTEQKRIIEDAADYYDKSQGIDVLLMKIKNVLKKELVFG